MKPDNQCQAGHKKHSTKKVKSIIGEMVVYDYEQYMGFAGYCTGQDAVSETIERTRSWDIKVHKRIQSILRGGDKGWFFDVGSHIGYFSKLALNLGYEVFAFEGNRENLDLHMLNAQAAVRDLIWFEKDMSNFKFDNEVELIKIDIEGAEEHAIEYFSSLLDGKLVKNIVMEVSPVFNDSYPELVKKIQGYGFEVRNIDGSLFDFNYDFEQDDLWFRRLP